MGIEYKDSKRIVASGIGTELSGVGGWKEVGRTTLGSATATLDVSSLPDKRYYMTLLSTTGLSQAATSRIRYNGDTGTTKAYRISGNGGSDATADDINGINIKDGSVTELPWFNVTYHANLSAKEKLMTGHTVAQSTAGAGNAPARQEMVGKQALTSAPIDQITSFLASAGNYSSGSEVVVLGWDEDDTHTTNFWEELASVSGDGTSKTLDSGTITAKKYLWVQVYGSVASQMDNIGWQFNSDTGSNYARRISLNGASDSTSASQTYIRLAGGAATGGSLFGSGFIINNSANEKLLTSHWCRNKSTGAGNAPERFETTGKWANTSSQITSLQFIHSGSSNWDSDSIIKVWGSD